MPDNSHDAPTGGNLLAESGPITVTPAQQSPEMTALNDPGAQAAEASFAVSGTIANAPSASAADPFIVRGF